MTRNFHANLVTRSSFTLPDSQEYQVTIEARDSEDNVSTQTVIITVEEDAAASATALGNSLSTIKLDGAALDGLDGTILSDPGDTPAPQTQTSVPEPGASNKDPEWADDGLPTPSWYPESLDMFDGF
nr:hypothetical protein [Hyphomonas sp. Mor2]